MTFTARFEDFGAQTRYGQCPVWERTIEARNPEDAVRRAEREAAGRGALVCVEIVPGLR